MILVTGAAGFVGQQLCGCLLDDGHQVVGVDCLLAASYDPAVKQAAVAPSCTGAASISRPPTSGGTTSTWSTPSSTLAASPARGDQATTWADTTKVRRDLAWPPATDRADGLRAQVAGIAPAAGGRRLPEVTRRPIR